MAELAKAHAKALMPLFDDGKEDQPNIEALTHEITDPLKRSEKKLQDFLQLGLPRIPISGKCTVLRTMPMYSTNNSVDAIQKEYTEFKLLNFFLNFSKKEYTEFKSSSEEKGSFNAKLLGEQEKRLHEFEEQRNSTMP